MFRFFSFCLVFFLCSISTNAALYEGDIRIKDDYLHFMMNVSKNGFVENGIQILENPENSQESDFCIAEEFVAVLPPSPKTFAEQSVNEAKILAYLEKNIAPKVNMEATPVRIFRDENGKIAFEGVANFGKKLKTEEAVLMIKTAIENHISMINLPMEIISPEVKVEDEELKKMGIVELVSVGRSDFSNSSTKRIQNVMAGANRFNGYIIPQGAEFSFNTQLGLVDASTGYAKEAIIDGPRIRYEYGGGLCQVSSTAYRGAMLAGLSIVERHNHSFAVNHYLPYGSDATIYQGSKDFRFQNDSPAALLMQTRRGGHNNEELFFHYYGTKDNRDVKILGPFTANYKEVPPAKHEVSAALPPGKTEKLSSPVRGFDATFLRTVTQNGEIKYDDKFFSKYQARPLWVVQGAAAPAVSTASSEVERTPEISVLSD